MMFRRRSLFAAGAVVASSMVLLMSSAAVVDPDRGASTGSSSSSAASNVVPPLVGDDGDHRRRHHRDLQGKESGREKCKTKCTGRKNPNKETRYIGAGCAASNTTFLFVSLTDQSAFSHCLFFFVFFLSVPISLIS